MVSFRNGDLQRFDWALMQNGPITLYYRKEMLEADLAWFQEHAYTIDHIDCTSWHTEEELHNSLAAQLAFPSCYGRNLDALNDVMSDLIIPQDNGRVLVFHQYDQFAGRFPELGWTVLDIIASQARLHLLFGLRLMALVQSDDPEIEFPRVGACPVTWNRREWLTRDRGI